MAPALAWLIATVVLLIPPLAVGALVLWARRLRRSGASSAIVRAAYTFAAFAGIVIVRAVIMGSAQMEAVREDDLEASEKARALGEGISEILNGEVMAVVIVGVGAGGLALWRRVRRRRR